MADVTTRRDHCRGSLLRRGVCWLDNLSHQINLDWDWVCDWHDRLIIGNEVNDGGEYLSAETATAIVALVDTRVVEEDLDLVYEE